jgi:hypothetical protein
MYNNLLAFFLAFSITFSANARACVGPSKSRIIPGSCAHCRCRTRSDQAVLHRTDPQQKHSEGKTPAYSTEEVPKVLVSIDTSHVVGHRDKAFLATLGSYVCPIGAVVNLKIEDYFQAGDEYLKVSKLREKPDTPLFPTTLGKSRELGFRPMTRFDGDNLLKRRLRARITEYLLGWPLKKFCPMTSRMPARRVFIGGMHDH